MANFMMRIINMILGCILWGTIFGIFGYRPNIGVAMYLVYKTLNRIFTAFDDEFHKNQIHYFPKHRNSDKYLADHKWRNTL